VTCQPGWYLRIDSIVMGDVGNDSSNGFDFELTDDSKLSGYAPLFERIGYLGVESGVGNDWSVDYYWYCCYYYYYYYYYYCCCCYMRDIYPVNRDYSRAIRCSHTGVGLWLDHCNSYNHCCHG